MVKYNLLKKAFSLVIAFAMVSGLVVPGAVVPLETKAAEESVYDFDFGDGISWPADEQLPTFKDPAPTKENPLDAIDMNGFDNFPMKYLIESAQGLINRVQPRLLLFENEDDKAWMHELFDENAVKVTVDCMAILKKYKSCFKGLVVYDEAVPDTANVATSISGADGLLVVGESNLSDVQKATGLEIKLDLRGRFADKLEAYNYLYDEYYSKGKLNKRVLTGLNPEDHTHTLRDFVVATKSAVLWLNPKVAAETAVMDKFYNEATPGVTYHLGYWTDEDPGVVYGTRKGVATIPSNQFDNMTVYMGQSKKLDVPETPAKPKLENKIYVAMALSDGDNLQYIEHSMMKRFWTERNNTGVPISWTFSPAMYYVAPQMFNYYYKTAENDMLICGPSGFGYSKSTRWREVDGFLDKYIAATDDVFERCGINIITMWDRISQGTYEAFSSKAKSVIGMTINNNSFNDKDRNNPDSMYSGGYKYYPQNETYTYVHDLPLMGLGNGLGYAEGVDPVRQKLTAVANSFDGSKPEFRFAQMVPWNVRPTEVQALARDLMTEYPGKFEFVRADHLFMLMNEYNNVPYNVALQKEATASYSDAQTEPHAAADGSLSTLWSDSYSDKKWYQVDLGDLYTVSKYTLKNAGVNGMDKTLNTKDFTFQTSEDGVNWKDADKVTGNTANVVYKNIAPVSARFVRVAIENPGADGVARIQDLEVYGNKGVITVDALNEVIAEAEKLTQGTLSDYIWNKFKAALAEAKKAAAETDVNKITETYSELVIAKAKLRPEYDVAVTAIDLPKKITLKPGEFKAFQNVIVPENYSDRVEWTSDNESVAKVSNGVVTAVSVGVANIKVTTERGFSVSMQVEVKIPVTDIIVKRNNITLSNGNSFVLEAEAYPDNATDKSFIYISSDNRVATVNEVGKITTFKVGTVTITVKSKDNNDIYATCQVEVVLDLTQLNTVILEADTIDVNQYTVTTVEAFKRVLATAKFVAKNESATQEEVDKATTDLNTAIANLVRTSADLTELNKAITTAETIDINLYTADSVKKVIDALVKAKVVAENEKSTQEEVYKAALDLNEAVTGLVKIPVDFTELNKAIAEAEAIDVKPYTAETVKVLTDAITAAKAVAANEKATQDEVNKAASDLNTAIKGLVKIAVKPEPKPDDNKKPDVSKPNTTVKPAKVKAPAKVKKFTAKKKGRKVTLTIKKSASKNKTYIEYRKGSKGKFKRLVITAKTRFTKKFKKGKYQFRAYSYIKVSGKVYKSKKYRTVKVTVK